MFDSVTLTADEFVYKKNKTREISLCHKGFDWCCQNACGGYSFFSFVDLFFQECIQSERERLVKENEAASLRKCRKVLTQLHEDIGRKLGKGEYAKSGGFHSYQNDMNMLQKQYLSREGLGTKVRS